MNEKISARDLIYNLVSEYVDATERLEQLNPEG